MKKLLLATALIAPLAACFPDAQVANKNLSTAADNFELMRSIVFYNTWTDTEVVSVTGFCSIQDEVSKLWVTCRDGDGFKRHQLGRSDNLSYFMTQMDSVNVSTYHTRVVWKPQGFIPDIDLKVDPAELFSNKNTDG